MPTRSKASPAASDLYSLLLDMSGEAVLLHSGGRIVVANAAAALLFGAGSAKELIGIDPAALLPGNGKSADGQASAYPKRRSVASCTASRDLRRERRVRRGHPKRACSTSSFSDKSSATN